MYTQQTSYIQSGRSMELSTFRRQLSNIPDNGTYRPETRLRKDRDDTETKSGGICKATRICQANKKLVCIVASVVLLGLSFSFGFVFGRYTGLAESISMQKTKNSVWCTDEHIDFKGANLIPRQGAQESRTSTRTPDSKQWKKPFGCNCERHVMPSAHLYLDWNKLKNDRSHLPWLVNTPRSHDTGHISAEFVYRPQYGGLEVTQGGIYNVYCQLTFRPTSYKFTRFVQCLYLASPETTTNAEAEAIVCTQTTKMNVTDVEVVQPTRLQAAIKVNIGDILFVNVSEIASVFGSDYLSYFGIFKIS